MLVKTLLCGWYLIDVDYWKTEIITNFLEFARCFGLSTIWTLTYELVQLSVFDILSPHQGVAYLQ